MKIAIGLGKWKSYVVMEDNGKVVKEGYTETTKAGFSTFFGHVENPKIIAEASSTVNRIANIFDGYDITVAHPTKVKLIAQSVKKTKFGDELTSKKWWMKKREQRLKDIVYNIYRYMKVSDIALFTSTAYLLHFLMIRQITSRAL